ncbi:MAG: V-type ATP synthase subunit I [Sedimentisphaerales bacterium]|nr:V-type ATP synthase subunit I [Sedimentisphaerales bacterium]
MAKFIIASHASQTAQLLEELQQAGICQILDADAAAVTKQLDRTESTPRRPKDIETLLVRVNRAIEFLKDYAPPSGGLAAILAPKTVIDHDEYQSIVSDSKVLSIVDQCRDAQDAMDKNAAETERLLAAIDMLAPWQALETPVEEITRLESVTSRPCLIPTQNFDQAAEKIAELGAALETIGQTPNKKACIVVGLNDIADELAKTLRAAEAEAVSFEPMTGTAAGLVAENKAALDHARKQLDQLKAQAVSLAESSLELKILADHYQNLLSREQTRDLAPATEQTVLLEGWVKKKDYPRLEKIVNRFDASTLTKIEPGPEDNIPVEIENNAAVKPFEVVTRLYGMPQHFEVDPTAFLAPFFALFFALCLTDAGYGLVMVAMIALFIKKLQGDKKLMWMLGICSVLTVGAGAITGGWFGNAQEYLPSAFTSFRNSVMWFDPLEKPMHFFYLSLALGYFQIMVGLVIACLHNIKRKDYIAAALDQLTWIVMLNSILAYAAMQKGPNAAVGAFFGKLALLPAAAIFLFSHREGSWGGRIGMGAYNLFSAIFYMGDVLSYLRLMALGMVTAGLAMAINVIAQIAAEIPYGIGFVLMIAVLVGGHAFNLVLSGLSAFVHTLRLQYVEFFPKFLAGGGRLFEPLAKDYKHIYIAKVES